MVQNLRHQQLLSEEGQQLLESVCSDMPKDLFVRMRDNSKAGKKSRKAYSEHIRKFALTLQFYSTKAYEYVRNSFGDALPHVSVIRSWYSSLNGSPGFTQEAFEALKCRVMEAKNRNEVVHCGLMIDEMSIRKHIEFDGQRYYGFVDLGTGETDDSAPEASEALVFMVVAINSNWKCPVGYFMIKSLTGREKASLVKTALCKLEEIGVNIVSLTCDGPASNLSMFRELGASIDPFALKTYFDHPTNSNKKIVIILDICHMIKLVRNSLATYLIIMNGKGQVIKWQYIEELHKLQEKEGFHAGNKLRKAHLDWKNSKMKVSLAMQVLSDSVATAIEWCDKELQLKQFKDSEATCEFIRLFNSLTDVFNSKNPLGTFNKAPMSQKNYSVWRPLFESAFEYILKLKDSTGKLLVSTGRKTAFIGYLIAIQSFIYLYDSLIETRYLGYLLTYKFSQDHLELFFCAIRSGNKLFNNICVNDLLSNVMYF